LLTTDCTNALNIINNRRIIINNNIISQHPLWHMPFLHVLPAGSGPLLPKPHFLYQALENGTKPKVPSILTSPDGDYWKAVRQAAAPCFSMSNLKQVGGS
jgi:hypothetical protein